MPDHATQFEATQGGLMLTNAILLYQPETKHYMDRGPGKDVSTFASIHPVRDRDGQPEIGAGAPLSRAHLRQWTAALGKASAPEILPESVLVAHPDVLAWWVPEQVRMTYFELARPPAGAKVLAKRTSVPIPYPAHLFVATRGRLCVYALPESKRPTAETIVLHSPVLNVYLNGSLCWGNIVQPKALTLASIPQYERAVFESWSTHPNAGQDTTVTGKGGLVRLLDDLAARRAQRFPVKRLKPFHPQGRKGAPPITLGQIIAGAVRS